jgi:proton-translocating NADH-quinone oxidoreductase chain N
MNDQILLLIAVFVPILGAFILPFGRGKISDMVRNILALILVLISLVSSVLLIPGVFNGNSAVVALNMDLGFLGNNPVIFRADGLAVFMAIVATLVGAVIVFYSFGYISHYDNQNEYYLMVVLFLGSMMGIVYSTHLIFLYLFWEISAICCWRLIGFFRDKNIVARADKAFLITVFGALMMLIGFIMVYFQAGTFDLTKIQAMGNFNISNAAVLMILFGILSKSATLPLHSWLPDAGVAPSPVTSLLHAAVLVKIGVYVFARLFLVTFKLPEVWHTAIPIIVGASALVSAGAAVLETDMKRIIAYSTISQLAFIFLGLSSGNAYGVAGGLLYILMHSVAKGGLFLCAGIVEQKTKTKDITKMGGLIATMPVTAVAFIICAFSVMGIPPFGGFFSKLMVIGGAVDAGQFWIALTFVIGAVLTVVYLLRLFVMVFLGDIKIQTEKEGSLSMLISVGTLAVLSILGGILIYYPATFAQFIVQNMGGLVK